MKTSEQIDKIAPAILKAQSQMGLVGKSSENKFDRYKYANLEDYYRVCRDIFHKNSVFITESVDSHVLIEGRKTKNDDPQYAARVTLVLRLTHDSGQWIEISSIGEGQDRGDKGTYKAITGARKYAIAMAANLVTSDDPEKDSHGDNGNSRDKDGRPRASATPEPVAVGGGEYDGPI